MIRFQRIYLVAMLAAIACPVPSGAQVTAPENRVVSQAAGPQYRAGPLHRMILGRHYRDLWTTPVRVLVLDLDAVGGGLTPTRTGGGMQTRSLRFSGADGREYAFRSVDKDPSPVLDSILHGTVVSDLVQDGISAAHPYGALVAAPLLEAMGILHVDPQLRVMPDDPRLGEFRSEFAGMLGLVEERPDENEGDRTSFRGTERVIASEALTDRLDRGPNDRVDARAYLRARLMDVFLGDWDRHRGQWRWATYDQGAPRTWLPVPRDRDQAFSKFDGLATRVVALYQPQFVRFEERYPSIKRLHWNARAIDRWFLAGLDREAWDEIGAEVQAILTDDLIEQATFQLPLEIYEIGGVELAATLRVRRDHLHEAWDEFYRLMSDKVDVRATDADDVVSVDLSEPGAVTVTISAPDESPDPYFHRRFVSSETREVRIHLRDGDDQAFFEGEESGDILVRVIGGDDDDQFHFADRTRGVRLYDFEGTNSVTGERPPGVDDRPFDEWVWTPEDRSQPLDWGRREFPIFWSSFSSDLGIFVGGGARSESYGFRKRNYASAVDVRGGYAPTIGKGRVEVDGRLNGENSALFWTFGGRVSRLDVLNYYGAGNETTGADDDFHEVDVTMASARVGAGVSPEPWFELTGQVQLERTSTQENAGRFIRTLGPLYGGDEFVALAVGGRLVFDPLLSVRRTGHRFRLTLFGEAYPELFDVERTFGRAGGEMSILLASSNWPAISFAARGGAHQALGNFPWHKAAFVGGTATVRGLPEQRFAGEAALFGSTELRLRVLRPRVIVPVAVGVFGFVDTGRVFLDSASPGGWHTARGGGLFLQPIQQPYIVRIGTGRTRDSSQFFMSFGLPY